ncbi:hypothetical protein [Marivirga harenae]|uniref:hypothetical protein n=1 Tax=Marivirga harenae TaxID=2010992 RepID=UPI0026DEAE7D|nr:hypothetical protein [Marivirga harenae]WKV12207.1 hypothetical protein Q3Y49_18595 [Marivirga harenae]
MKKIISLIIFLIAGSAFAFTQSLQNNSYTVSAARIVNGNTSMTVSSSSFSTSPIASGEQSLSPGFQSLYNAINSASLATEIDSLALVDLYNATNSGDTTWNNASGWLTDPLDQWQGVGLNAERRVNFLDLSNNNLTGALPESFKNLDALQQLYFYINPNLEGELFDFLRNFPALERVSAHDCNFTGLINPEAFQINLVELRVHNNAISDSIPIEITNSPNLDDLTLNGNNITGSIPAEIGQLRKLRSLDLSANPLEGNLPTEIGLMDSLKFLYIEQIGLTGEVPPEILNCMNLQEFWFSENNFSGSLPDVFNLPNFRALQAGGNVNLLVDLPDNIGDLTQLEFLSIWNTRPNGGAFPEGVYNLTNLYGLDLSEQFFTGTIDERIGNLVNLEQLYLRNNLLEGAFPIEIMSASGLHTFDISSNNFDFMPDISGMANLQSVNLIQNRFQFESLIPYLGISEYFFMPQRIIGNSQDIEVSIGSTQEISSAINEFENVDYQWILNGDSLANASASSFTIENFTTSTSGRYFMQATHPDLPELILNSAPINLKIAGGKTNWYIDNRSGTIADFRDLSQAINATKSGDTLYIAGSNQLYTGGIIEGARIIIGPGYFLEENPNTQFNTQAAEIDFLDLSNSADGSEVYGISTQTLRLNNQSSSAPDTLKNVIVAGNRVKSLSFTDKNINITVRGNIINELQFASTSVQNVNRSYNGFTISNNIIDTVNTFFDVISTEKSSLDNMIFDFNNIRYISDSINDLSFSNSIIGEQGIGTNTFENNIDYDEGLFTNSSGDFTVDNDYTPINSDLPQGAFAGTIHTN